VALNPDATHPAPIRRRSPAGSLEYIASRLEAAVDDGTEQTLRTVASQAVFSLRMLASEAEEPAPAKTGPRVLNVYTGEWVLVAAEDQNEVYRDPDGVARRYQQQFRDEWYAEHPEAPDA
jgi:hypothetical protein